MVDSLKDFRKMNYALWCLCKMGKYKIPRSGRIYDKVRMECINYISEYQKGKKKSKEQNLKMVKTRKLKGNYIAWNKGLSIKTDKRVAKSIQIMNLKRDPVAIGLKISKTLKSKNITSPMKGKSNPKVAGKNNGNSKDIIIGKYIFCTLSEAEKITGVSKHHIRSYLNGEKIHRKSVIDKLNIFIKAE